MYCKNCGNKLNDDAKFCTKCGAKTDQQIIRPRSSVKEPVNKGKYKSHKSHKSIILTGAVVILAVVLAGGIVKKVGKAVGGDDKKTVTSTNANTNRKTKTSAELFQENIEKQYGIAEGTLYGKHIVHSEVTETGVTVKSSEEEKFVEGTKGGSVLYKELTLEGKSKAGVSVYLCDTENHGISLKAGYSDDQNYSYIVELATPKMKSDCYAIVGKDYFASVKQEEEIDLTGKWVYTDTITIWKLSPGEMKEAYTISRKIESGTNDLKAYQIKSDSDYIIYAEGYSSYTAEGATFVSTEQEFDDQVRKILQNNSLDCISLNEMTYENRWEGIHVDNNSTANDIAKVEFATTDPYTDENGEETSDIEIIVNGEDSEESE